MALVIIRNEAQKFPKIFYIERHELASFLESVIGGFTKDDSYKIEILHKGGSDGEKDRV